MKSVWDWRSRFEEELRELFSFTLPREDPYATTARRLDQCKGAVVALFGEVEFGDSWNYGRKGGGFHYTATLGGETFADFAEVQE